MSKSGPNQKKKDNVPLLAVVEGGGTSFRVAVCEYHPNTSTTTTSSDPQELVILHRDEFDASDPQTTLQKCADFFQQHKPAKTGYSALGVATFGPVGVHTAESSTYGCILPSSPKATWRNVNLLAPLQKACQGTNRKPTPALVETDVNAPALAEYQKEKKTNPNIRSTAYITVGTGVGVGLVVNGKTVHGRMHPEGGHLPIQPLPDESSSSSFEGYSWGVDVAPFGGKSTVEGVASTVALTERLALRKSTSQNNPLDRSALQQLSDDDPLFDHAANALASLCASLLLMLSMEKIVLGGGLMNRQGLLEKIQARTVQLLNGYLPLPDNIATIIACSTAGNDAGLEGAMVLAKEAYLTGGKRGTEEEEATAMKQTAFNVGLWHGIVVGAVGAAAVMKYFLSRRRA